MPETPALDSLLGKSVGAVVEQLQIELDDQRRCVFYEPPMLARGIQGFIDRKEHVYLYVPRANYIMNEECACTFDQFKDLPVAGIAWRRDGKWRVVGDVFRLWHMN